MARCESFLENWLEEADLKMVKSGAIFFWLLVLSSTTSFSVFLSRVLVLVLVS